VKQGDIIKFDEASFNYKKDGLTLRGCGKSGRGSAPITALSRAVIRIVNGILNSNINIKQQVLALRKASLHPLVRCLFKSAGLIDDKQYETMKYMAKQMETLIKLARTTDKKKGRAKNDKRGFVEAILLAVATTPTTDDNNNNNNRKKAPSMRSRLKLLGIPNSSEIASFKKLAQKRKDIREG